jgi:TonB family protein
MPIDAIPQLLKLHFVQIIGAASTGFRGGNVKEPKLVRRVDPALPRSVNKTIIPKGVQLEMTIDEQGNVAEAHIVQGHPLLNRAAIEAVGQWKYTPLCGNDIPLPAIKKISMPFRK